MKFVLSKVLVVVFGLAIILAVTNVFSSGLRNVFLSVSSPFSNFFWSLGKNTSSFLGSLASAGFLSNDNYNLKEENQKLLSQVIFLQDQVKQLKNIATIQGAIDGEKFDLLPVKASGLSEKDILSVNKGLSDGILENMPVINQNKAIVGVVVKVYKDYSAVMLISSLENGGVGARVIEKDGSLSDIEGVVKGAGSLSFLLDFVPVNDELKQNSFLITSELEDIFPPGLLIGEISEINKNDQDPHQKAKIDPFFKIGSDSFFVITNYKRNN